MKGHITLIYSLEVRFPETLWYNRLLKTKRVNLSSVFKVPYLLLHVIFNPALLLNFKSLFQLIHFQLQCKPKPTLDSMIPSVNLYLTDRKRQALLKLKTFTQDLSFSNYLRLFLYLYQFLIYNQLKQTDHNLSTPTNEPKVTYHGYWLLEVGLKRFSL